MSTSSAPLGPSNPLVTQIGSTIQPVECSGVITNKNDGYFIQDLKVDLFFVEPSSEPLKQDTDIDRVSSKPSSESENTDSGDDDGSQDSCKFALLGNATTQVDGSFHISWIDSPKVKQARMLLAVDPTAFSFLEVKDHGKCFNRTEPAPWGTSTSKTFTMALLLPRQKLSHVQWKHIAETVQKSKDTTLSQLVQQLVVVPTSLSTLSNLTVAARHEAVAELEKAFLDPDNTLRKVAPLPSWNVLSQDTGLLEFKTAIGKAISNEGVSAAFDRLKGLVEQFPSISTVDWKIDPKRLNSSIAGAITANPIHWGPTVPFPFVDLDQVGYRDYLLKQYSSAMKPIHWGRGPTPTDADFLAQLHGRFHQDFTTKATFSQVSNEILIPIMSEILTAATNDFGFGVTASSIPARGTDTARAYLNKLISLSGFSATELSLRYRTDFNQPDSAETSPAWINVKTLQGFFADSFLSVDDPFPPKPDIFGGQALIPKPFKNCAPFFLQYDEWVLRQQPIPYENFFQIRSITFINVDADDVNQINQWAATVPNTPQRNWAKVVQEALKIQGTLQQIFGYLDQLEFGAAAGLLQGLQSDLIGMVQNNLLTAIDTTAMFQSRKSQPVNSFDDLFKLMSLLQPYRPTKIYDWLDWDDVKNKLACFAIYNFAILYPWLVGQVAMGMGDLPKAVFYIGHLVGFLVGKASISTDAPYRPYDLSVGNMAYHIGDLPYTVRPNGEGMFPLYEDDGSYFFRMGFYPPHEYDTNILTRTEIAFVKLRLGEAILQWADNLYRTDQDASIARARELYKGIYFLHGLRPPIDPTWSVQFPRPFIPANMNPAKRSQIYRARRCFSQIAGNLNFFGYPRDVVPALRYASLKQAADAFAASAKSIESDFLNAMAQQENLTIETLKNTAMLQRATAQQAIAQNQENIAADQLTQANFAVSQVQAAITAKQSEIDSHDSFFGQLGDYISGLASIWKGLPDDTKSVLSNSAQMEAGMSQAYTEGFLGAGAGATVTAGFAAFFVVSYITMSGMADAQNGRQAQLQALKTQNLPAAQAQADATQKNQAIAQLNETIAASDAALAQGLIYFTETRFLNAEFWSYLATFFQRVLRQYLDLASRTGWLAERALAYELNTPMGTMKLDYYNEQKQGAGSADALQLDLASLEAERLQAQSETLPIKFTVSLSRDFPLQFGQLKATNACSFQMTDALLLAAYPGTYAHRVLAIQPQISRTTVALKGLLSNSGISSYRDSAGNQLTLVRSADALPISEWNLTTDAILSGLPGPTLMPFEGSGIQSIWTLNLPPAANPGGLSGLLDVLLTFSLQARFSPTLYQTQLNTNTPLNKTLLLSLSRSQRTALTDIQANHSTTNITLDKTTLPPHSGTARKLNNIFIIAVSTAKDHSTIKLRVSPTTTTGTGGSAVTFSLTNFSAYSNAPPITDSQSTAALSPLNALAGADLDKGVMLSVRKADNAGVDFSGLEDLWVGLDCTTTF